MSKYDNGEVITIQFSDGTDADFKIVASGIQYRGNNYSLIQPVHRPEGMGKNDVLVCTVTTKNGTNYYGLEENDKYSDAVIKEYNNSLGGNYSRGGFGEAAKKVGRGVRKILILIGLLIAIIVAIFALLMIFLNEGQTTTLVVGIVLLVLDIIIVLSCYLKSKKKKKK